MTGAGEVGIAFSLIVAVLGDGEHLDRLLASIIDQGRVTIEVIIVDQNGDGRLNPILASYESQLHIRHLRSARGLSLARNVGLAAAEGAVLAFPDDDCWYPPNLLTAIQAALQEEPRLDGLTCRCTDEHGRIAAGARGHSSGPVTRRTVWGRGVSATMFMRRHLVDAVGPFDVELGLGCSTPYQSGEETDYLLRALRERFTVRYDTSLCVHHPLPLDARQPDSVRRAWAYALGMGRVLRLHGYGAPSLLGHLTSPCLGAAYAALRGNSRQARLRLARALGRYRGWRGMGYSAPPLWTLM